MSLKEKVVDKSIPVPLYYQLKQHLRDHIKNCRIGDPIPTETELCEHFEVSRPTVRQAVIELVNEGYLTRSKGKGTFVTKPKVQRDFLRVLQSFNQEMQNYGLVPSTRVIELCRVSADAAVAEKLTIKPGSEAYFLRRVRSADRQPVMVVNSFLPTKRVSALESHDLSVVGLHSLLTETYGYQLARAVRTVEAIMAPKAEAELLDVVPGSPLLYVETVVYTEDDVPIEFSNGWYRGDHSRFTFELRSGGSV